MSFLSALPLGARRRQPGSDLRLHPYVALVTRYWAVVLVAALIGALAGWGLSQLATQAYTSRATLYFSIGYGASGSDLNQGSVYAQSQMASFAELATTTRVLDAVVSDVDGALTAAEVAAMVDVTTPADTVVIDISATSADPQLAATVANATARSLSETVHEVAPRDADGRATVTVRTVEQASPAVAPSSPNTRVNVVAGVILGLVVAVLAIIALRLLDTRVRGSQAVEAAGALPVLARVRSTVDGDVDEDARRLLAGLRAAGAGGTSTSRTFIVAGVVPGEAAEIVARRLVAATVKADRLVIETTPDLATSATALVDGRSAEGVILVADTRDCHIGELREAVTSLSTAGVRVVGTVLVENVTGRQTRATAEVTSSRRARTLPVLEHNEA